MDKTITSPHFPFSKAPDLDITNSNSGTLLFVNIHHFQYQYSILTCFSHLLGKLCSSWSKYRGNTILTSKLAKFNSLEIKAYSRWDHHLNVNLQEKQQWWCLFFLQNGWWFQGREYGTKTSTFPIKAASVFVKLFSMTSNKVYNASEMSDSWKVWFCIMPTHMRIMTDWRGKKLMNPSNLCHGRPHQPRQHCHPTFQIWSLPFDNEASEDSINAWWWQ